MEIVTLLGTVIGISVGYYLGLKSKANETHVYHYPDHQEKFVQETSKESTYNNAYGDAQYMSWLNKYEEGEVERGTK